MKQIDPSHRAAEKSRRVFLTLFGGALILNLFVIGLLGLWQYQSWLQTRARALTTSENLANAIQRDIHDNIVMIDIALLTLGREKLLQREDGHVDLSAYRRYFQLIQERIPELYAVRITNADGAIIASSDNEPAQIGRSLADRDYFIRARDDRATGLIISKPLIGSTSHKWTIVFARRLEHPDGSFDGIVYGALILERYLNLFAGVDIGSNGILAMRDADLNLIVRQPNNIEPELDLDLRKALPSLIHAVEASPDSGYYENRSLIDQVNRILFYRHVGDYPLYVVVGLSLDDAYAPWRRDLYRMIAVALAFCLASVSATGLFWRSWHREAEITLRALEANRQLEESLAALKDRDADLRATQEVARLGVYSHEFGSGVFHGSDELREIFGLPLGEPLLVERWYGIIHDEDRERMRSLVQRSLPVGQFTERYRAIRPSDGETIWLQVVGKVECDENGTPVRLRGAVQDITQRCLAEQSVFQLNEELEDRVWQRTAELESLNEDLIRARDAADAGAHAKADFLANMSHEIRTPMNAVIGFTHLVSSTELTARQRDYVDKIMMAARSLLRLINDVLDFSKIDAGKMSLEAEPFLLDEVITQVSDLLAVTASEKRLDMEVSKAPGVPPALVGDAARLHQILLNLMSNAVKFTESGSVRLSISVLASQDHQIELRFEVADSGIGLSEEQQKRLFTPFDQADSSITRRYGGTGLGLAIARRLVGLMRGEIGVDSRLGEGARFWFTAHFEIADPADLPAEPAPLAADAHRHLAGTRVLVVEDNEINRMVTKDILEHAGITPSFAENGVEGVRAVLEETFDAVLMDVQMPRMDGYTATRLIRGNPGLANLPIIALTANAMPGDRDAAFAAGMNDYITKPVDPDLALATLARWIKPEAATIRPPHAPEPARPSSPVVDRIAGLRRVGGNKALYEKILGRFCEDAGQFNAKFSALWSEEHEAATRLVHSLKSNAGTIGADEVQRRAAVLEAYCREGGEDEAQLAALCATLEEAIGDVLRELSSSLGQVI